MDYEKLTEREIDELVVVRVIGGSDNPELVRLMDFSPTTDAKDRDQVVEKMRELGWHCHTDITMERSYASFYGPGKTHGSYADNNKGRAVCIAALKAREVTQS